MDFMRRLKSCLSNGLLLGIAFLAVGILIYYFVSYSLFSSLNKSLVENARHSAKMVEVEIKRHIDILETISSNYAVKSTDISMEEKLKFLKSELKRNEFKKLGIIDTKGTSKTTDRKEVNVSDRTYFKKALSGQSNVSDPLIGRIDSSMIFIFAVPVLCSDNSTGGVLYAVLDADLLCKLIDNIKPGSYYSLFIINKSGAVIADENRNLVYSGKNLLEAAKKDTKQIKFAGILKQMAEGKTSSGKCNYKGKSSYIAFAPIAGTDWSIAVAIPKTQVLKSTNQVLTAILILIILISFLIIFLNIYARCLKINLYAEKSTASKVVDATNAIIIYIDLNGEILYFNKYAEEKTGYSKSETVKNKTIFNLTPENKHGKLTDMLKYIIDKKNISGLEFSLKDKDGNFKHIFWNINFNENSPQSSAYKIELIGLDITTRVDAESDLLKSHLELSSLYEKLTLSQEELSKQYDKLRSTQEMLMESEKRYALALEASNDGIWDWDISENKIHYSEKFVEMLGYNKDEMGDTFLDTKKFYYPDDIATAVKASRDHYKGFTPFFRYEARLITKSGNYKWFLIRGKAIKDNSGKIIRMAGSLSDIDERKTNEQLIQKLAYYDSLTALPNRTMLYEKVQSAIIKTAGSDNKGALILIDLDNFKDINDYYGHSFGDLLLKEISSKLSASVENKNSTVFRFGGDEFIILVEKLADKLQCNDYLVKIMEVFSSPITISDRSIHVTSSIGISLFPDDSNDVETLLRNSDSAMYCAKKKRKRKYLFFDKGMNDEIVEKMDLENKLRKAIENNEFVLYYQPQIVLKTGKIRGFEALIRWLSPDYGLIPPTKFINIAEETGLIIPIGDWVLKTACRFNKYLQDNNYGNFNISVNISIIQLTQDNFVDIITKTLEETGLKPQYLELELTESILMESIEQCMEKLEKLRKMGIKVSLDDFGKGYSSFSYLKQLPINVLKIDKSFIDDIGKNLNITESIVHFGHKMGLNVIAEGVENSEQLDYLIKSNCNIVQGYFFSKPVPEQEAIKIINTIKFP